MAAPLAIAGSPVPVRSLLAPAVALPVASFTLGAATVAYLASGRVGGGDLAVVVLAACLVWPVAAAVLLDRRPGHPLGPVLCMPALVPLIGALAAGRRVDSRPLPSDVLEAGPLPAALLACLVFVALPLQVSFLGHPSRPGRRPRGTFWTALAVSVLTAVVAAAPGAASFGVRTPGPPIGYPGALGIAAVVAAALGAHAAVGLAWRRSAGAVRDLLGWYLIGSAVLGAATVALALVVADGTSALALYALSALLAAAPATLTLLLLSPSPPALDLALARGAAFVVALVALGAVYLAAVAGLAATGLPDGPLGAALLTGTAALVAVPAWGRCRSWVEDLVFGSGRRPETVLRDMRRGLGDAHPAGPLTAVTDWVAAALRSPGARVCTDPNRPIKPQVGGVVVPLRVGGADVGCLELAPRARGERYGRRDLDLVEQLGVPVALVAQAVATGQALARSRQQVTDERARERRRVLDDLHDGLGPSLAGVGLHLSAARQRLASSTDHSARAPRGWLCWTPPSMPSGRRGRCSGNWSSISVPTPCRRWCTGASPNPWPN